MIMTLEEFENEIENNEIKIFKKYEIDNENFLKISVNLKIGKIKFDFEINDDDLFNLNYLTFKNKSEKVKIKLSDFEIKKCNVDNFVNTEIEENLLNKINKKISRKIFKNKIKFNRNNF